MKKLTTDTKYRNCRSLTLLPLLSLGLAAPVLAEQADAAIKAQSKGKLEEVVVTAQRREENLSDVPIAVVALSESTLQQSGVNATISLPELVPSVQLARSGPSATFFVRGVGNTSGGTGEEGTNAFYVDGVFIPDLKQVALKFNNIERIEVLKGPQGTLFGRNSSGGLVNVITQEPGEEAVGKFKLGYANYDTYSGQAYIAGPLTETVSADIALTGTDQKDGWGENLVTGDDVQKGWDWGARSKWVVRPDDDWKITLAGEYLKMSDDFTASFRTAPGSLALGGTPAPDDPYDINTGDAQYSNQRNFGLTATIEVDLTWAMLTSITGGRNNKTHSNLDADGSPTPWAHIEINSRTKSLQEEIRLASYQDGPFTWQTGLFFLHSESNLEPQATTGTAFGGTGIGNAVYSTLKTDSYAAFGEVSYAITSSTQLTAGVRYTSDKLDFNGVQQPVGAGTTVLTRDDSTTEDEPTWRLALRQDLTDNINIYASYNRGYKSGTYSMSSIAVEPVQPQTIDAYEIGLKSQLLDDRLRLNIAAFQNEVQDYQVRSATGVGASAVLLNAAEVESKGVELEFEALPWEDLRLNGAFTWLSSEFTDFPYAPYSYPRPGNCNLPGVVSGAPTGGTLTCIQSGKGNDTPISPEFAGNLGITYTIYMSSAGELDLSLLYNYNSGFYFEPDNRLEQPSFETINGSINYRSQENWGFELWGRNLTDEIYYVQLVGSALGDIAVPAAPRTYGINFTYEY